MINTSVFYPRFRWLTRSYIFNRYLNWAYSQGVKDLSKINYTPNFKVKDFTCLQCGCASEYTANIFINFVLSKNPKSKIIIVDIGKEQIKAIKNLVKKKYPKINIDIIKADLLTFKGLKPKSMDWIETDAVLGHFNDKELTKMLSKWNGWLKDEGFITLREGLVSGYISLAADNIKRFAAWNFFATKLYKREKKLFDSILTKVGFKFFSGLTLLPSLYRYSIIKQA